MRIFCWIEENICWKDLSILFDLDIMSRYPVLPDKYFSTNLPCIKPTVKNTQNAADIPRQL